MQTWINSALWNFKQEASYILKYNILQDSCAANLCFWINKKPCLDSNTLEH